jgi:PAS domain S-box-containing protein
VTDRILVVEDSATQAEALCALLEESGYAVDHAPTAEEALARIEGQPYALVLTDVVMPGLSGYDLCRRVKALAREPEIPVVLVTSLTDPLDIVRGLECGADNYVTKPYDAEHLLARVRQVLDRPKLRRQVRASMGVNVAFLGTTFSITAEKEQILDLFISSVEDVVRANHALRHSQRELARAQRQLEAFASRMAYQARVSSEKYATLMEHAHDGILVLDARGAVVEANVRALALLGRDLEAVRGQSLDAFVGPDQRDELRARIAELGTEVQAAARELWFIDGVGRRACCDVTVSRSQIGDECLLLAVLHDVTERKRDQEALARNSERLRLALDAAQIGTWEWNVASGELLWSAAESLALGPSGGAERWSLDAFLALVDADDRGRVAATLRAMAGGAAPREVEFCLPQPDHEGRRVQLKGRGVPDDGGGVTRVLGVVVDVTHQRRLEAQLQQAQKMEAVGQLAGGVAHDFNNLLTAIIGYSEMLLQDLPPDDAARADVQEVRNAAGRAELLTRQLLAFSRQQVLQPRVLDVNETVANIESLLRRLIPENIAFRTPHAPALHPVHADPGQLEQVLVNLAVNARDAMAGAGALTVATANVVVDAATAEQHPEVPPGDYVALTVSDTGSGIDPAIRGRIFEPFFTTKEPGRGTGLGLATVYGIVTQSGGHVTVESELGRGTTFRVYLPRVDRPVDRSPQPAARAGASGGTETILLVEDDADLRTVVRRILHQAGYTVVEASDGAEALRQFERLPRAADLVLSDVVMPTLTGPELAHRLRALGSTVPVLLISGYTADAITHQDTLGRGVAFLEKPFTPAILSRRVREVLDGAAGVTTG